MIVDVNLPTTGLFGLRSRSTGKLAVMSGSLDTPAGTLVFESRDEAQDFHRHVIGNHPSISRQKRRAAQKDWKVVGIPILLPDHRYCLARPTDNGHDLYLFNL